MKIEKIHLNKIKVTFSPKDLIENNLSPQAVRDNSPWVQKVLMNIVHRAWEEVGFAAENSRLMVEAMPGEDDCMVMYITKLEQEENIGLKDNAKRKIRLRIKHTEQPLRQTVCITFGSFEDALSLASFARDSEDGDLYFLNGSYYLIVSAETANRYSEFGVSSTDDSLCLLIQEHGAKICGNALKTLRENF